jgi:nucleoside-diphosphate-sugar epimerase
VTVLNRGKTSAPLPGGVATLVGDMNDVAYGELADRRFDVVAQFRVYTADQMRRDIETFTGKTGQYVFISSASVYVKPVRNYMMTERTPLENRYWQYSRDKIACELLLRDQEKLAYTIVRPSHTVRTAMPIQVGNHDSAIRRMIAGKPVIVPVDAHPVCRFRAAVRAPARQFKGSRRRLPHHCRSGLHLEPDPRSDRARLRR